MRHLALSILGGFLLAAVLSAPAWGADVGRPGTINYVEGNASIGAQGLDAKSVGTAELERGQSLVTQAGKAEILLTPGAFLRLGDNSAVTMVSAGLTNTQVRLDRGYALVEVTEFHKENNLLISQGRVTTRVLKTGLYGFDASQNQVRVFDGKAVVNEADRAVELKGGRQLSLDSALTTPEKFNKKQYRDDLYNWSKLRSSYLAEANVDAARVYVSPGPLWYGSGWYWNPWFNCYTFIPGDGILYSPFGWGFYSPIWVYEAPIYYNGPYYRRFTPRYRPAPVVQPRPGVSGGHSWMEHGPRPIIRQPRPTVGWQGSPRGESPHNGAGFHNWGRPR